MLGEQQHCAQGSRQHADANIQTGHHQQPGQEVVRAGKRKAHQLTDHLRPEALVHVVGVEPFRWGGLCVREQYADGFALHQPCVGTGRRTARDALHQRVGAQQRFNQRQVPELRVAALDQAGDELAQDVDERAEQLGQQDALLGRQAGRVYRRLVKVMRQLVEDGQQQHLPVGRVKLEQRVPVLELGVPARLLVIIVRRYAEQPHQPERRDEIARERGHVLEAAAHQLHQRPNLDVRKQIVQLERLQIDGQLVQGSAHGRFELVVLFHQRKQGRTVLGKVADRFTVPHGTVHQIHTVPDDGGFVLGGGGGGPPTNRSLILPDRTLFALDQLEQYGQIVVHREHLHDEAPSRPARQLIQRVQILHQPVPLFL
uniref:Uncharacterized protein n=1 Tax=Anopheles maculatus TaxID=74869 RepID=A0A182SYK5_9DIPT